MVDENVHRLLYYNKLTVSIKISTIVITTILRHYFLCLVNNTFFYTLKCNIYSFFNKYRFIIVNSSGYIMLNM